MRPEILPNALHGEPLGVQANPRKLTIEENILHQLDRIGFLRSIGEDWQEPVFHLRDLIVGLEDYEFWDGIPMNLRDKSGKPHKKAYVKQYHGRGWDNCPVRIMVKKIGKNKTVEELKPTASELSNMLRIIMALLARRGMTWRRKTLDEIPDDLTTDEEE